MKHRTIRTLLSLLCAVCLLLSLGGTVLAAEAPAGEFTWTQNPDGTLTLTGYTGTRTNLYVPAVLEGHAVTAIGKSCFAGRLGLQKIHVPEGVTRLDSYAFECCADLQKVYLPDSLISIGEGAFSGCASLSLVDLQDGVESIGAGAFLCCDNLVQLELSAALTQLGDFAFAGCQALASVRFAGNGVTRLPDRLFYGCSSLSRLQLPGAVTAIGKRTFSGCEKLRNLYFSEPLTELGAYAFENCGSLAGVSFTTRVIPTGLFAGCMALTWFSLPEGTERIEADGLAGAGIEDLTIPASVTEIAPGALRGIERLSLDEENPGYVLTDGSLYTADGKTLLAYCTADPWAEEPQTEFIVPEGVEVIAAYALAETALTSVILPQSLKRIDANAFKDTYLEDLQIPEGVLVDPEAFGPQEDGGQEPDVPVEPSAPEIIGSVAGEKNLFRPEDYADYLEISNEDFDAWGERYMADCADRGLALTAQRIPYIIRYKGEVVPHFTAMTAVQNHDPDMWAQAAEAFGDDFAQMYLMMDHGLFTELSRGKMPDNLVLYSGLYDSQLMAAASTDTVPTQAQLVDAIGTTFTDPIMISTTTDPGVAAGFGNTLFIIYASRQAMESLGAVCIDAVIHTSEKEILMNANARYRILDVGNMAITHQEPWDPEPTTLYRSYVKVELLAPEPAAPVFTDVPDGAFFHDPVYWAARQGITTGTSETTFSPLGRATRAQVVTFLWRAQGAPAPGTASNPFADVAEDAFYRDAVLWAAEQGITSGTSNTAFSPDKPCTRAEFVTFLHRFAGSPAPVEQETAFTDLRPGAFYVNPVLWAVEQGITTGTSPTTFGPDRVCTRGEVVTFLYRHLGE